MLPEDAPACLAHRLDHRRSPRAHAPSTDASTAGWCATHGGTAAPQAPRLAAGGVLSVHRPRLRPAGSRGHAALGQERGTPYTLWQRSQLAPSALGLRSVTGLEAPARGSNATQATQLEGRGLSGHLWVLTISLHISPASINFPWLCRRPSNTRGICLHWGDRKSTRLNSSHLVISYAVFCLKKKKREILARRRDPGCKTKSDGDR